jgi:hypothetical protein
MLSPVVLEGGSKAKLDPDCHERESIFALYYLSMLLIYSKQKAQLRYD